MTGLRHTRWKDHVLYRLVAAELREQRVARKVEQQQLASALGMTNASLNHIEQCYNRTSLLVFVRACRALGLRPGEVLDRIVGWIDEANLPSSESLGTALPFTEGET